MGIPRDDDDPEKLRITTTNGSESVPQNGTVEITEASEDQYGTTKRGLKSRDAQMIALGGSIGTG
ncbi:hypothetical protein KC336_g21678, partial [Hortaea werneckii]